MNRAALQLKMITKYCIAAVLLGFVFLSVSIQVLGAIARLLHYNIVFLAGSRPWGGGDYLVAAILFTLICLIGFAALRGAREISRELSEPEPPLPDGPPGHQWDSPAVEVKQLESLADGTPVSIPNEIAGSRRTGSAPSVGKTLIWIGHAIAILTLGISVYAMLFLREGGGIALGFVLALLFYIAGAAVRLLD